MRSNSQRATPQDLHIAIISRNLLEVKYLLQFGVDAGIPVSGATPISVALYRQDNEMLKTLLDHHNHRQAFNLDLPSRDHVRRVEPPLITACRFNNFEAVQLLVESGANLEAVDHDGRTALHMAVYQRSLTIVQYLIDKGVSVNPSKHYSKSPLFASLGESERREKIAELLILSGADVLVEVPTSSLLSYTVARSRTSLPYRRILQLMISAGYCIATDSRARRQWQTDASFAANSELYDIVSYELANPISLQRLCLFAIRQSVSVSCRGRYFQQSLQKLPLPRPLLDLVALSDYRRILLSR